MSVSSIEDVRLSAADVALLEDLLVGVEETDMSTEDVTRYAQEIGACWHCTACISCRCMIWSYH